MTTTTITCATGTRPTRAPSIVTRLADGYRAVRQRRHERRAIGELRGLSGHTLKDIGLHRSEITSIVCVSQTDRRRRHANN